MTRKTIRVMCSGTEYMPIDKLKDFQGAAKGLHPDALDSLKASIMRYGFTAPVFVWKSRGRAYILDGHQRLKALRSLAGDGYVIPEVPVVTIEAKDKAEATAKLLVIGSQYGEVDTKEAQRFADEHGVNMGEVYVALMKLSGDEAIAIEQQMISLDDFFESIGKAKERTATTCECPYCGSVFER